MDQQPALTQKYEKCLAKRKVSEVSRYCLLALQYSLRIFEYCEVLRPLRLHIINRPLLYWFYEYSQTMTEKRNKNLKKIQILC